MPDFKALVGQRIIEVRAMTRDEIEEESWDADYHALPPMVVILDQGTKLYSMRDEEGNGAGCLVAREGELSYYVDTEASQ